MIDLIAENWSGTSLSGTIKVIAGDAYELRIAGLNDGGKWKLNKYVIVGTGKGITIEVLPQMEIGWLRVVIKSKTSQVVKWKLNFNK